MTAMYAFHATYGAADFALARGNTPTPVSSEPYAQPANAGLVSPGGVGSPRLIGPQLNAVVSNYTAILSGQTWYGEGATNHPVIITYSFSAQAQPYLAEPGFSEAFIASFHPLSGSDQNLIRGALSQWAAASGIIFEEAQPGRGDIQFGRFDFSKDSTLDGFDGWTFYPHVSLGASPNERAYGSDVFFNNGSFIDTYLALHEIGHALGFKHPFEGDPTLDPDLDDKMHTVMSYTGHDPTVLGPLDHDAVEHLYGDPDSDGTHVASWSWNASSGTLTQTGGVSAETIRGIYGPDVISGGGGADLLFGSFGNDVLAGGAGNDIIGGADGIDRASYADASAGVVVNLAVAGAQFVGGGQGTDNLDSIENLFGSAFGDALSGGAGANVLWGAAGSDVLRGGAGNDTLNGGAGIDSADYSGVASAMTVHLTAGDATGQGSDTLIGIENVIGSAHGNLLVGDGNANVLTGGAGIDRLIGALGDDSLIGAGGTDTLLGGAGRDTLIGGLANDVLTGGGSADAIQGNGGVDTFVYASAVDSGVEGYDAVFGFDATADVFDVAPTISAIDAAVNTGELSTTTLKDNLKTAVNKHVFGADHAIVFTPDAGDLAGQIFLVVDLNGKAGFSGADLLIHLDGAVHLANLDVADFI